MIYLDNAATTFPKPPSVIDAVAHAMRYDCVNAGRGGYAKSVRASSRIYSVRENIAEFFGLTKPENCIFTCNATAALNIAIKGLLSGGGHAVVSSFEHNAVMRPLEALRKCGVTYDVFEADWSSDERTVANLTKKIRHDTKCVVCIYASNICGYALPIEKITKTAHSKGIPVICDASQAAGVMDINVNSLDIDFLAAPGHKSLYGPQGTGILLVHSELPLATIVEGGTGTLSKELVQPADYPERLEAGTLNFPGIVGLGAGIDFVRGHGREIHQREGCLMEELFCRLSSVGNIVIYPATRLPVLSFNIKGVPSEEVGGRLDKLGFAVRCGLHCAPAAHRSLGTLETGTVRASIGAFTSEADIKRFVEAVCEIAYQNS